MVEEWERTLGFFPLTLQTLHISEKNIFFFSVVKWMVEHFIDCVPNLEWIQDSLLKTRQSLNISNMLKAPLTFTYLQSKGVENWKNI